MFGAGQVEFLPGDFEGFFLQFRHALGQELALVLEQGGVHVGAVAFDAAEHGDQGQFDVAEHLGQAAFLFQFGPQGLVQTQGHVGVFGGVAAGFVQAHLVEGELLGAFAGDFFEADGLAAQVLERQGIHVVAGGHGIEYVGFQHGVVGHAAQGDTHIFGQHAHVVLQVLADFLDRVVFQQRFEGIHDELLVELVRGAGVVVAEGDVGSLVVHGHAEAHQFRVHVVEAGGFGVEGKLASAFQFVDPLVQLRLGVDDVIGVAAEGGSRGRLVIRVHFHVFARVFGHRVLAAQQLLEPALEFQGAVILGKFFRVRGLQFQVVQVFAEFAVQLDGGELVGEEGLFLVFFQFLAQGLGAPEAELGHLVEILVDVFQGAQALDQAQGGLLAHAGDAGDVVHLVAHEGEEIDDQLRAHAELLHHAVDVVEGVVHGVDQGDLVGDQLGHVLVAGGDQHRFALFAEDAREGADHVVRFHPFLDDQRQAHGADQVVQGLHLFTQIIGHGRAVGFVFLEQFVAEGLALGVENHRHVFRVVVLHQFAQHGGDSAHRPGGLAAGGGERRQGVKGAVQVGRAIDEDDGFFGCGHGARLLLMSEWGECSGIGRIRQGGGGASFKLQRGLGIR